MRNPKRRAPRVALFPLAAVHAIVPAMALPATQAAHCEAFGADSFLDEKFLVRDAVVLCR